MTTHEVLHRLRERWRRGTDKVRYRLGIGLQQAVQFDGSSFKTYLREGPARRFYSSTQERGRISAFMEVRFPEWLDRAIREAEQLLEHRVEILANSDIPLGPEIDWHRDPISEYDWPRLYCSDYDLIQSAPVDPKIIHELNRQQHLPRLAKGFFLTGDERYAREAVAQIETWIEQNPKCHGLNWQSSLEISLRAVSWMWTLFLILDSKALDEHAARRICGSLFAQLDHVYRYPSTYTSPNTHLIGEAAALFLGGLIFREVPHSESWRRFGSITLMNEMQRQVSDEGVYCELSSYYHCYAADFYVQVLTLAQLNRCGFPNWMWNKLSQMLEFVLHLTRPDASIPLLGDDDGGRALALCSKDYGSFVDGLCSGAVLFGRGDFKFQAGNFQEESLWLLGQDAFEIYASLGPYLPEQLQEFYPDSGYLVQRSGWAARDYHAVFDCGGLGQPSGGHGHADALSVVLFGEGRELLIDSGTSVYNCAPEWRSFFRSTRAHNTVVVDGMDQSETDGTFSWKRRANAYLTRNLVLPGIEYIDAEHDGYSAMSIAVTHRRRLVYVRPNYWIVLDELSGRGEHDYQFFYHFAPEAEFFVFDDERRGEVDCRVRTKETGLQMFLYASGTLNAQAICGQTNPIQGWSSRRYGERRPSPVLCAELRGLRAATMMTFLAPGLEEKRSARYHTSSQAIAASLRDGEHDDIAVVSTGESELHVNDAVMRGEFFWIRTENGMLKQLLAVNARSFSYCGDVVFETKQPSPYVLAQVWENGMVIQRGEDEGKVYVRDLRNRQFQRN